MIDRGCGPLLRAIRKKFFELTKARIIKDIDVQRLGPRFYMCFVIKRKDEAAFKSLYYDKVKEIADEIIHYMYGEDCKCGYMYITKEDLKEKYGGNTYYAML